MKLKKIISLITAACAIAVCICIAPSSAAEVDNAQIKSLEQQIAENNAKQQELRNQLDALSSDLEDAWEVKNLIDASIETTAHQITAIETIISQLEAELTELAALEIETTQKIADQRQAFLDRMVALHEDGNASYLELVLGAEDLSTFLTKFDYVNSMLEYDKQVMADLRESKKLLDKTRTEKEADLAEQKAAKEQLNVQIEYNNSLSAKQQEVINQINADTAFVQAKKDEADALDKQFDAKLTEILLERQRQEELAKQQEQTNNNSQSSSLIITPDGEYMWPLTTGYISSPYGYRSFNGGEYHLATDIAAPTGTPIHAANNGTVVISDWHDSYGNYVLISHGNGESTLYAHMSVRMCSTGQVVSKGDVIGQVGNTGYSFGSHLHLEFRINGERVDAQQYIASPY